MMKDEQRHTHTPFPPPHKSVPPLRPKITEKQFIQKFSKTPNYRSVREVAIRKTLYGFLKPYSYFYTKSIWLVRLAALAVMGLSDGAVRRL